MRCLWLPRHLERDGPRAPRASWAVGAISGPNSLRRPSSRAPRVGVPRKPRKEGLFSLTQLILKALVQNLNTLIERSDDVILAGVMDHAVVLSPSGEGPATYSRGKSVIRAVGSGQYHSGDALTFRNAHWHGSPRTDISAQLVVVLGRAGRFWGDHLRALCLCPVPAAIQGQRNEVGSRTLV